MNANKKHRYSLKKPPPGAWIEKSSTHLNFGATTKSTTAYFTAPFMTIWSGFGFVGLINRQYTLGKLYAPTSIFFILIAALFIVSLTWLVMSIAGKVEVKITTKGGTVFKGIGTLGIKKTFLWSDIISDNKKISFGYYLSSKREDYIKRTFNYALKRIKYNERF